MNRLTIDRPRRTQPHTAGLPWVGPLAIALGMLCLAPPAPAQSPESAVASPRAIAPDPVWDAGLVGRGAKIAHEFVLRNEGIAMLQLREVRPSCGCTVVSFDAVIPPGSEGTVRTEVDTSAFVGAIAKEVTVFTNDATNPAIQLTVRAEVQSSLDAQPGYFRFMHVQGAPAESTTQVIWSPDFPELQVLSVESPLPSLTFTFRPASDGERQAQGRGKQWVLEATLASEPPAGGLTGEVSVTTNHPRQPVLAVPIAGYVRPPMMVSPPVADFGRFEGGEPRRGSVLITNYSSTPLKLLGVDTDVHGLTARIEEREKGKKFDIALTLDGSAPKGPFTGALRVRTDSARQPLLEVQVKGEVK